MKNTHIWISVQKNLEAEKKVWPSQVENGGLLRTPTVTLAFQSCCKNAKADGHTFTLSPRIMDPVKALKGSLSRSPWKASLACEIFNGLRRKFVAYAKIRCTFVDSSSTSYKLKITHRLELNRQRGAADMIFMDLNWQQSRFESRPIPCSYFSFVYERCGQDLALLNPKTLKRINDRVWFFFANHLTVEPSERKLISLLQLSNR